jgi:hypothetical protein
MLLLIFLPILAIAVNIGNDSVVGQPCGYFNEGHIIFFCERGLRCDKHRICTKWLVDAKELGHSCGLDFNNGTVDVVCSPYMSCVDSMCMIHDIQMDGACDKKTSHCAEGMECVNGKCKEEGINTPTLFERVMTLFINIY